MLVKCPECELQVSDKAIVCPHCGYPLKGDAKQQTKRKSNKRRRLPNGFGQISEIKNRNLRNPYRAMVTVGKTDAGRPICKPLKPEAYFPTYNDAYAALVEYNKNPYDLDESITMSELYEKWSETHFKTLKNEKQAKEYERTWAYCEYVYKMRVKDIRPRHIKYCMENGHAMVQGFLRSASARKQTEIKTLFNLMLDYAVEYEMVDHNVSRNFKLPKDVVKERSTVKQEHIPFDENEMDTLWHNLNVIENIDILLIQCYSGWRPQELCLIKTSDVDLEKMVFTGGMKTESGINRTVPIHSRISQLVKSRYDKNNEYLFMYNGSALTYDKYLKQFNKIKYILKLNPDHRPHDGRKHFVTMAKKYNVDEYAIKYMVGHSINDITEKIYTQRDAEWLKNEIEKIK